MPGDINNNNNNNNKNNNQQEKKEKIKSQPQKKSKKENKKPEDDWDEIENMLDSFKEKDKNICHLFNCGSSLGVKECVFCNMIFCIEHIRQPIHDCNYLKNMPWKYHFLLLKSILSIFSSSLTIM